MRVLYDHQIFSSQKYGGISRYFYELMREFQLVENIRVETSTWISNNHYIADQKFLSHLNFFPAKDFKSKHRLMNIPNTFASILKIKKNDFDIFHPTYYDPYFFFFFCDKPFLLTVYDMIHEKFSEMFSPNDKTCMQKKLLVEKATKVITISQSTKKDLIELFGTDQSKIDVIYLGNSMFPPPNANVNFKIPKKYLLFVGARRDYKNFERFIKSVSGILKQDKALFIVCVGGGKFIHEMQMFSNLGIAGQVLHYTLDDEGLAYVYNNALAFIFPSLYEGFGIPILEAFACGCPLVCSHTSSLPEVAEDGAYYFDPYSAESMQNAILKVLEDSSLREKLRNKGFMQLKKFSWKHTAEQTKKVYANII